MGTFRRIIIWSIVAFVFQHFAKLIYLLGFHKTVYNHTPGPCKLVEGVEFGSEDIATLPNGKAFISSGTLVSSASQTLRDYYIKHNVKGKIFLFDFNEPDKGVTNLEIRGDINVAGFRPHGLDYWKNENTGQIFLFVVNHEDDKDDSIEKFEYKGTYLQHIEKYQHESMFWLNDVAAAGENSFYYTNSHRFRSEFMTLLEVLLFLPLGNVVHYDGHKYSTEVTSLLGPNGITLSLDKRYLYVAVSLEKVIKVYKRHITGGNLSLEEEVKVATCIDNLTVDQQTGNVLVGAHPVLHQLTAYVQDPRIPSSSQVLMINIKDGHATNVTELYSEDGHTLYGSSVASLYHNKMLIGTVLHKLMYCEVNVL